MTSIYRSLPAAFATRPRAPRLKPQRRCRLLLPLLLAFCPTAHSADVALAVVAVHPDTPAELARLSDKTPVRISGIPLDRPGQPTVDVNLQKFNVFAPDAKVTVRDAQGERVEAIPALSHFKGDIDGHPGSVAFWSVAADGRMRGILHLDGNIFVSEMPVTTSTRIATTQSRRVDNQLDFRDRTFKCEAEDWHDPVTGRGPLLSPSGIQPQFQAAPALTTTPYAVRIAIDTDYEFYQLFNDSAKATGYVADLFAYISIMYSRELQATLQISDLYLYATANDPWNATNSGAGLTELKNYWTTNRTSVSRALVHQISGKSFLAGNAYLDVLCDNNFGYGYTAGLSGEFSPGNPQLVWDAAGVAHEIGHNFSSPHTHCYAGIGGNANPVDGCSNTEASCYSGIQGLPGVGSLSGGTPGTGTGTIMSYCQFLNPFLSNVSMTLGLDHVYGIAAGRVPTRMRTGLEAAVASAPACFASSNAFLLVDKVGGGVVASSPAGIDCGNDCSESYPSPASVTLTATPVPGYVFGSWSGDCTGAGSCNLSVSGMRRVTANFNLDPGFDDAFPPNGSIPNGWVQAAGSSASWVVATDSTLFGPYSLKPGVISDGQTSGISYTGVFAAGSIRFARRVSSEAQFDFLRFYIDGVQQAEWSGDVGWDVVSFPVTAGAHTIRWRYEKDAFCCIGGSDAGWIDYVSLPTGGGVAPVLQSAASRKVHGSAGTYNLPLSLVSTSPTTEPRQGATQTIVFTFDKPITGATVTVTQGTATAASPIFSNNDVIVGLSGVTNQQYVTVALTNVASADGGTGGGGSVRVGFLLGDVSQNRVVTLADLGQVNAQVAQLVSAANYLKDVNASGTLSLADKGITNTQITKALPAP